MEIKKIPDADIENRRLQGFLIGLIVVLALFLVALEWNNNTDNAVADHELSEDLGQDVEMTPVTMQKNMVALQTAKKQQAADKINVVKDMPEEQNVDQTTTEAPANGHENGTQQLEQSNSEDDNSAVDPIATDLNDNPLNFRVVESLPEFPGGAVEFMKWLTKNLRYPYAAQQQKIQGKVLVQFIVNKDGSISDIKVIKTLNSDCDREALRVLRMMPHWKAGTIKNKLCRTKVVIPINFKL